MRDGQSFRLEIGQRTENAFGLASVRRSGQRPLPATAAALGASVRGGHRFVGLPDTAVKESKIE